MYIQIVNHPQNVSAGDPAVSCEVCQKEVGKREACDDEETRFICDECAWELLEGIYDED